MAVFGPGIKHATPAIYPTVAGQRCGQHHKVDNPGGNNDTDFGKGQYKRAACAANSVSRENGDDHKNGTDMENQDTPQDIINRTLER